VPLFYTNTDFLSHVFHRNRAFAGWYVASPEAVLQYEADGLSEGVRLTGIPVHPAYADPPSREEARARLGLPREGRVLLVMSGGIGVGPIEQVVGSLARRRAGSSRCLRKQRGPPSAAPAALRGPPGLRIEGFVGDMPDRYAASDLVVMKPGGLSTSEVLCVGLPILLIDPIPGQEQRNSDYLLDRGAARVLFERRSAGEKVRRILDDPEERERLRRACAALARPLAGREIARDLLARLDRGGSPGERGPGFPGPASTEPRGRRGSGPSGKGDLCGRAR
jgi:processive 1,2-diacylglycerol beta-glucosyltransferase